MENYLTEDDLRNIIEYRTGDKDKVCVAFKYRLMEKHNQISKYAINKLIKMALNIQNINQINSKLRLSEQNKILQKRKFGNRSTCKYKQIQSSV